MPLTILSECPSFEAKTQDGAPFEFKSFANGSWVVLFSYPADFTPVCSTEMADFAKNHSEFKNRNCKVVGISSDSVESHKRWLEDVKKLSKHEIDFPVLSDENGEALTTLGLTYVEKMKSGLEEPTKRQRNVVNPVRGLYIISPSMAIQYVQIMPPSAGRNLDEVLRVLDAVQLSALQNIATPAGWHTGQDVVLLPDNAKANEDKSREGANVSGKVKVVFPYLKFVQLQTPV